MAELSEMKGASCARANVLIFSRSAHADCARVLERLHLRARFDRAKLTWEGQDQSRFGRDAGARRLVHWGGVRRRAEEHVRCGFRKREHYNSN